MRTGLLIFISLALAGCQPRHSLKGTWKTQPDSGVTLDFPSESTFVFTTKSRLEGTVARTGDKVVLVPTNVSSGTMELDLSSDGKTLTKNAGPGVLRSVFKKL